MKKFKTENGITLVALVITIIVLLILAGVTITLILGKNGIIDNAQKAKQEYEVASAKEKLEMALTEYTADKFNANVNIEDYINKVGSITKEDN